MIEGSFKISIPSDDDGFISLQCSFCSDRFKLTAEEFEADELTHIFCPYCGLQNERNGFLTDEVREQIHIVGVNYAKSMFNDWLKKNKYISSKSGTLFKKEEEKVLFETQDLEIVDLSCCKSMVKVNALAKEIGIYCPLCGLARMEIEKNTSIQELKNISYQFRTKANNFLQLGYPFLGNELIALINFIDKTPILHKFIQEKVNCWNYQDKLKNEEFLKSLLDSILREANEEKEISFVYQLFKKEILFINESFNNNPGYNYFNRYFKLAFNSLGYTPGNQKITIDKFNKDIIKPHFIDHIQSYLMELMNKKGQKIEKNLERTINTQNYYEQNKSQGIANINNSNISEGGKVAGIYNEAEQQDLAKAAEEIQNLLKQLEESNPTNTTAEKMKVATLAIEQIESDPTWKQRAINAVKGGTLKILETNPIGAFVVGAIEGWTK